MYTTSWMIIGMFVAQLAVTIVSADGDDGWTAAKHNIMLFYDLEMDPLQIKTDSAEGSEHQMDLTLYDGSEYDAGGIFITFSSPPKYRLKSCMESMAEFPSTLPADANKVWTITSKTEEDKRRVVINCNNKEVLNVVLSDTTCSSSLWKTDWTKVVMYILFEPGENVDSRAADFYRPAPCLAGNYEIESECQQCGETTYSGNGATSCTSCSDGKISDAGSTAESDCYYAPCSAGNYMTEDGCQQCEENTYSGAGASSCSSCPDGKTSTAGSTSEADCEEVEKQKYSGAVFNSLSGIIMTLTSLLTLLICHC